MSDHYYSKQPNSEHARNLIKHTCRGITLSFVTDAGVFSRKELDFGTRTLIEQMALSPNSRILDLGCGYGPIGCFAAALADGADVTMVDMNERALSLAGENVHLNRLGPIRILQSDGFDQLREDQFDTILTNPPIRAGKSTVYRMFEEAVRHLYPQGELWVVIQKKQGAPSTLDKLKTLFPKVREVGKWRGYWVLCAKKIV